MDDISRLLAVFILGLVLQAPAVISVNAQGASQSNGNAASPNADTNNHSEDAQNGSKQDGVAKDSDSSAPPPANGGCPFRERKLELIV